MKKKSGCFAVVRRGLASVRNCEKPSRQTYQLPCSDAALTTYGVAATFIQIELMAPCPIDAEPAFIAHDKWG